MAETPLHVDDHHRLPDQDWAAVVARAKELAAEQENHKTGGASPVAGDILDLRGRSNKHSGTSGIPTQLLVLHSAECPLAPGYAQSLTEWAITSNVVASWHRFVGPDKRVYMIDDALAAWHASEANPMSIGWEQAGYARYTRADWTTPLGLLQLESLAFDMAQVAIRDSIPAVWLSTEQVTAITTYGDRTTKGFCLHRQIDPETRTDPGDGYPYDLLMARIRVYMGATPTTEGEDFLMALPENRQTQIADAADRIMGVITDPDSRVLNVTDIPAIVTAILTAAVELPGGGTTTPATKVKYQKQEFNVLGAKLDALTGAVAALASAQPGVTVTREEILGQLDASIKDHLADYTPAFIKSDSE